MYTTEEKLKSSIKTYDLGVWKVQVLDEPLLISEKEKAYLEAQAELWAEKFAPLHANWLRRQFGAPTVSIRFDYVLDKSGVPRIFEIEDRPTGFEVAALVDSHSFQAFKNALLMFSNFAYKPLGICVSKERMYNSDDYFWIHRIAKDNDVRIVLGDIPKNPEKNIWFVRSLRSEEKYYHLDKFSVSTTKYEGDKGYGKEMNLWTDIPLDIDWSSAHAFKPESGCRCENIHLWSPTDRNSKGGFSTKTKIENAIKAKEVQFMQDYFPPETVSFLPENYLLIRRTHAVFSLPDLKYRVVGGQWEARPNCTKIHGASDAVCGPMLV